MKISAKKLLATLSMLTVLAVTPTSAFAGDSVHISVPGISIGFHGDHHSNKRYRKQYSKKRYNNNYRSNRSYNNNYYSSGRSYNRGYNDYDRSYSNNYDRGYNNYDRSYNNNYRSNDYRRSVCPIDGYSQNYDRDRNCYEHEGHYHCS